jgi:hypothetical protein
MGVIRDGELHIVPEHMSRWRAFKRRVAGKVHVRVAKSRGKRSIPELRWIRGVAIPLIAEELGYDKHEHDDLHYHFLRVCFGTRTTRFGEEVPNVAHTGDLNTKEAAEYMEWLSRYVATEFGIVLPMPNELSEEVA